MAIGTLAAIGIGAAGIGSAVSASKQSSAAKKAAQVASDTSLEVADRNNALTRELYDENKSALAPWQRMGLDAAPQINAILQYLPDGSQGPDMGYLDGQRRAMDDYSGLMKFMPGGESETMGFDAYKRGAGYQGRMGAALDAVRGGFSGAGTLQSGAALKGLSDRASMFASDEYGKYLGGITASLGAANSRVGQYSSLIGNDLAYKSNYINSMMPRLNALEGMRNLGFNAVGAQAGLSTNFGQSTAAQNQTAADTVANAALYRASNAQSPVGNALSLIGGGMYGFGAG